MRLTEGGVRVISDLPSVVRGVWDHPDTTRGKSHLGRTDKTNG